MILSVAYDRRGKPIFRVVTLNGEVINTSGAMQGGGRRQIKGLITLSRRGESIKPKGAQDQEEGPTEEQVDAAVRAWKQCDHAYQISTFHSSEMQQMNAFI